MGKACCGGGGGETPIMVDDSARKQKEENSEGKKVVTEAEKKAIDDIDHKTIAYYLRKNLKASTSITGTKRVEYFRGVKAAKMLIIASEYPVISKKRHAVYALESLLHHGYFHRAAEAKNPAGKKILKPVHPNGQKFLPDHTPFIWTYDIGQWKALLLGIGLILGLVFFTLQPLWPRSMQVGIGYLFYVVLGLLGLLFVLTIFRLILFVLLYILSGAQVYFWLYPQLYTEEEFWASFVPLYSIDWKGQEKNDHVDDMEEHQEQEQGGDEEELMDAKIEDVEEISESKKDR